MTALNLDERQAFSAWLTSTMANHRLSQADVSRRLNLPQATVSRWCHGHNLPNPHYLKLVADAFSVSYPMLAALAGYPSTEGMASTDGVDGSLLAEIEAHQGSIRRILTEQIPPELWSIFMDTCAKIGHSLGGMHHSLVCYNLALQSGNPGGAVNAPGMTHGGNADAYPEVYSKQLSN